MNISPYALFSGLISGAGGAAGAVGQSMAEEQRRAEVERLARDKMAQEQQYRDAMLTLERDKIAQAAKIHEDSLLGVQLPPEMGGGRSPKELLPFLFAKADAEAKRLDETGRLNTARSAILNQPARPEVAMPAEGSMYSEAATLPGKEVTPKNAVLAAIFGQPGAAELLKQLYPEDADKGIATDKPIYKNGQWIMPPRVEREPFTPPEGSRPVPTVGEDGKISTRYEPEPRQHELARRALADKGWQPGMKGYNAAFYDAVSALTPVVEGGGAATRSQGLPSPDGRGPAQTPTVITGPQKPISGEVARSVAGAEMASQAVQRLVKASQDPAVQNYLGPYDQYRSDAQRRAPQAALGEVPMEVVDLDQDIATTKNYLLNLRSGAAVTPQEGDRMEKELMKKSSRGPVFQREVENTARNIQQLEQRVKELALRGDQRALAVADQYGLLGNGVGAPARPQLGEPGYTGRIIQPDMPQTPPGPGKVWIKAPDGVWGKWDARQPIPQGYMR